MNEFDVIQLWSRPVYITKVDLEDYVLDLCINRPTYRIDADGGMISTTVWESRDSTSDQNVLANAEFKDLKAILESKIRQYIEQVYQYDCQFEIINSWVTIHQNGDKSHKHLHRADISGCLYVSNDPQRGGIIFEQNAMLEMFMPKVNVKESNQYNSNLTTIQTTTGALVLFPSFVEHSTEVNQTDQDRVVLAFDVKLF